MTLHPRPRLSLHVMVLNGSAVVERAIRPLLDVVDEFCLVDTGSTDGTMQTISRLVDGKTYHWYLTNPHIGSNYFPDEASSWKRIVPGPFTGLPLLRDWSHARNLGLDLCTGQYVLKLDADDECLDPGKLSQSLDFLDQNPEIDFLACPYEVMDPATKQREYTTMYTRLWRNKPEIRFREVCHENVDYLRKLDGSNWRLVEGLSFRDHRDSPGDGVRVAHRNYKVLLREYERAEAAGEPQSPHLMIYLAEEAIKVDPKLSFDLCERLPMERQLAAGDRAWIATVLGECCESLKMFDEAIRCYKVAAEGGSKRAALLSAMLESKRQLLYSIGERIHPFSNWKVQLRTALAANRRVYYPRGASESEMKKAMHLLQEKS